MSRLDLSDPDVRAMAERNHEPEEQWIRTGTDFKVLVTCGACRQLWRCPTRLALDDIAAAVPPG